MIGLLVALVGCAPLVIGFLLAGTGSVGHPARVETRLVQETTATPGQRARAPPSACPVTTPVDGSMNPSLRLEPIHPISTRSFTSSLLIDVPSAGFPARPQHSDIALLRQMIDSLAMTA